MANASVEKLGARGDSLNGVQIGTWEFIHSRHSLSGEGEQSESHCASRVATEFVPHALKRQMRIESLPKIQNHRMFRDFVWPNGLSKFQRYNLIFGWNGCGKTTLSQILKHLERREAIAVGKVEFHFSGGKGKELEVKGKDLATAQLPVVRVFNREFVDANVHQGGASVQPVYYLGEESASKQKEVERLSEELKDAKSTLETAGKQYKAADSALNVFQTDGGSEVRKLLQAPTTRFQGYDRRNFVRDMETLQADSVAGAILQAEARPRLTKALQTRQLPELPQLTPPVANLRELQTRLEALLEKTAQTHAIEFLAENQDVAQWVQAGLKLHKAHNNNGNRCLYCQGVLNEPRVEALNQHFSDAVVRLQRELGDLQVSLRAALEACTHQRTHEASALYPEFETEWQFAQSLAQNKLKVAKERIQNLLDAIERKLALLFTRVELNSDLRSNSWDDQVVSKAFAQLNQTIEKHNAKTKQFNESLNETRELLAKSIVAERFEECQKLTRAKEEAEGQRGIAQANVDSVRQRIHALEAEVREHRRAAKELNAELRSYLGRDELQFAVKENGYELQRYGHTAQDLSEGEKSAVAFLYFLKSLQDRGVGMKDCIVVIDDPVCSMDTNSMFCAFGYMKERTQDCGQLFILTHSFSFFRQVKNWFHHIKPTKETSFHMLKPVLCEDGQRSTCLVELDPTLREHDSEYQYLFKQVWEASRLPQYSLSVAVQYSMPNIARRFLEAFLAFRYP